MTSWRWLDERDARAIHERLLMLHGGAEGVRDPGLLASALARAEHRAAYDPAADVCELAASFTAGIVKNHPFIDGNKRVGFVLGVLFLEMNGMRFTASEEAATRAVLDLADGTTDLTAYAAFLRDHSEPDLP